MSERRSLLHALGYWGVSAKVGVAEWAERPAAPDTRGAIDALTACSNLVGAWPQYQVAFANRPTGGAVAAALQEIARLTRQLGAALVPVKDLTRKFADLAKDLDIHTETALWRAGWRGDGSAVRRDELMRALDNIVEEVSLLRQSSAKARKSVATTPGRSERTPGRIAWIAEACRIFDAFAVPAPSRVVVAGTRRPKGVRAATPFGLPREIEQAVFSAQDHSEVEEGVASAPVVQREIPLDKRRVQFVRLAAELAGVPIPGTSREFAGLIDTAQAE